MNIPFADHWLKICGDIATAGKHFQLTTRRPITESVSSEQGFGVGRFGMGGFGVGKEGVHIQLNDGTVLNCFDFVREVVASWERVFVPTSH